jgi:Ala-tRNA(Pro) deacylase
MSIAPTLRQFLDKQHAHYEVIEHPRTASSMETVELCHIPPERMAKAVLLYANGDYMLAVLPADHRIQLSDLRAELGQKPRLADEHDLDLIFTDCIFGAVPPLGSGYGVPTIVDDSLTDQPEVYFEAGDHISVIHMNNREFSRLTRQAKHGRFSEPWAAFD